MNINEQINEIIEQLDNLGGKVNWQNGMFDGEALVENAEKIIPLLNRYLELKNEEKNDNPYLEEIEVNTIKKYNPNYGDDRMCECGHSYYRHFDTYEDMYPCGCKYCGCYEFKEKTNVLED